MAASVRRLVAGVLSCRAMGCRTLSAVAGSPWRLHGAVCLKRAPVVAQSPSAVQREVTELFQQIELENSLYSDHELKLTEDQISMRNKQLDIYDSDFDTGGKDIIMAQDLEDIWEQNWRAFKPAARKTEADERNDRTSLNRRLENTLLLLVKEKLGNEDVWLFPSIEWQAGEYLRQTAERALSAFSGNPVKAHFLGNAPCGFYKYKFPKAMRADDMLGAKVFFFKAILRSQDVETLKQKGDYVWVTRDELKDYLKPAYLSAVEKFIVEV